MTGLMLRCDAQGCLKAETGFEVGEKLRIISGPFADFISTVESIDHDQRVYVLLDMMGRQTRVEVQPSVLSRQL